MPHCAPHSGAAHPQRSVLWCGRTTTKNFVSREDILGLQEPWQLGDLVPAMFGPWVADLVALASPQLA